MCSLSLALVVSITCRVAGALLRTSFLFEAWLEKPIRLYQRVEAVEVEMAERLRPLETMPQMNNAGPPSTRKHYRGGGGT